MSLSHRFLRDLLPTTLVALTFVFGILLTRAASRAEVVFPVAELGGCGSEGECRVYCDDEENAEACLAFAEREGVMEKGEVERARAMVQALRSGESPGGCTSREACETFCSDVTNIETCLAFAERHGIRDEAEVKEMRKVAQAIQGGVLPPGGCRSKKACESFCEEPEHAEECLAFAEKAGFIEGRELEMARKALPFLQRGETPGGCRGKESCDAYCKGGDHTEECVAFAEKAGFMSREEAEIVRKTGGRGPGDCRGKEECEVFCNSEENQETCFSFGKEHGLISDEDLKRMEEGRRQVQESFGQMPEEVLACLTERLGAEELEKIRSGALMPGPRTGEAMRGCFEAVMPQGRDFREGGEPGRGEGGREAGDRGDRLERGAKNGRGAGEGGRYPMPPLPDGAVSPGGVTPGGQLPPDIRSCLEGSGLQLDTAMTPDARQAIEECVRSLRVESEVRMRTEGVFRELPTEPVQPMWREGDVSPPPYPYPAPDRIPALTPDLDAAPAPFPESAPLPTYDPPREEGRLLLYRDHGSRPPLRFLFGNAILGVLRVLKGM